MTDEKRVRIELTDEQKKQIKEASREEISVLEFSVRELEERIAPIKYIKWD
jgi:uncharacterized small protein (DUF1192 family)